MSKIILYKINISKAIVFKAKIQERFAYSQKTKVLRKVKRRLSTIRQFC